MESKTTRGGHTKYNMDVANGQPKVFYASLTGAELSAKEYHLEYLIPGLLARGQHTILGGPHKTLKTLYACDLGLALATGGTHLGHFTVPRPTRTAIMSGECGYPVLQEYLRRIAKAANTPLDTVGNLLVSDQLPWFGHIHHIDAMRQFISDNGLEVVVIDPAYLCMDGADASNVFAMGKLLRSIADVFVETNCTMVLVHHARGSSGADGEPIQLSDLSFAGFREFAAQWLLLSRRRPYEPGTGHHELWLTAGGRAGHSGLWGLTVDEGRYEPDAERYWDVEVSSAAETRAIAKDNARSAKRTAKTDDAKRKIVQAMLQFPEGETKCRIMNASGVHQRDFDGPFSELVETGDVVSCNVFRANRKKPYEGYRLSGDCVA